MRLLLKRFTAVGCWKNLRYQNALKTPTQNAVQGPRRQVGHFAGIPFHSGNIDTSQWKYRLPSSTDTSLISEMEELETVLARRAEALGVEIKRGLAITDFHQTEDGVTVQSGDQSFQSKWLVGCDGSRSVVRKAAVLNSPARSRNLPATLLTLTLPTRRSSTQAET